MGEGVYRARLCGSRVVQGGEQCTVCGAGGWVGLSAGW